MLGVQLRNFKTVNTVKFKADENKPTKEQIQNQKLSPELRDDLRLQNVFDNVNTYLPTYIALSKEKENAAVVEEMKANKVAIDNMGLKHFKPQKQTLEKRWETFKAEYKVEEKRLEKERKEFNENQRLERENFEGDQKQRKEFEENQLKKLKKFIYDKKMKFRNQFNEKIGLLLNEANWQGKHLNFDELYQ